MWRKIWTLMVLFKTFTWAEQPQLPPLEIHLSTAQATSGDTLNVVATIPHPWHLTSNAPKSEFQIPMEVSISSQGTEFGKPIFPEPTITPMPALGFDGSWFKDSLVLKFPIQKTSGTWNDVKLSIYFQACTDVFCIAPRTDSITLSGAELAKIIPSPKASAATPAKPTENKSPALPLTTAATTSIWQFLLLAFLGGMILNLMPCVLPVLGLKVFSLIQNKDASPRHLMAHAASFGAGTLASFWVLAGVMISLKQAGKAVGWGFQFQEPGFVLFMALIVALFALNLLGMFEISLGWRTQTAMDKATRKDGLWGAFWSGAFMTLLATPCTAPMLSPAMAFAFSQPDYVLVLFMSTVALGLALPYILVCVVPGTRRFFPKPGDWMVRLKEGMGYLLLLTLVWLLYTFGQMCGNYALSLLLVLLILIAMAFWTWKALPWCSPFAEKSTPKWITILTMIIVIALFGKHQLWTAMQDFKIQQIAAKAEAAKMQNKNLDELSPAELYKKSFDPELIKKLNAKGIDVFVDFTADWCISCHANEKIALQPQQVDQYFREGKPVFLIGDYTHEDPLITAELKRFGRSGVPMYVLYKADGTTEVLPEVITPDLVLKTIGH